MGNQIRDILSFLWLKASLLLLAITGFAIISEAQVANVSTERISADSIELTFVKRQVILEKGQIISNVLKVYNKSTDSIQFKIDLNFPPDWSTLLRKERIYQLSGSDSMFVPVRLVPQTMMKGNTKYFINGFLKSTDDRELASDYFFASTNRISQWEMSILPTDRIYFKNGENETSFKVNLFNSGNEDQDLMMTMSAPKSNLLVMDTTDNVLDDIKYDFTLKPLHDTTFDFRLKYIEGVRNFKNIDIENYNPTSINKERRYNLYLHSEEPRRFGARSLKKSTKVDLVKLANDKTINPYGSDVLPLTAYLRVTNLLDDVVFSSLHLNGNKYLNNGGQLIYNASMYFSSQPNFYKGGYAREIPWYVGYFDDKKNLQVGYINGGAIGSQSSGKGVKGEIEFVPKNRIGGFYIRSPYFFSDSRLESFGVHHRIDLDNFSNKLQYSHSNHLFADVKTDILSANPKFRIAGKHNLNFTAALSNRYYYRDPLDKYNRQGYLIGAGYSSSFVHNIWRLNIRGSYTSKGFGAYGFERWYLNHRSRLKLSKDVEMTINNNYNQYTYDEGFYNYVPGIKRNYYFFNSLTFYSQRYFSKVKPGLFYDVRDNMGINFHNRGVNFTFNNFDIARNMQFSLITSFALSKIMDQPLQKNHFNFKLNTMVRYHNLSFTGFYTYGPYSPQMIYIKEHNNVMPQNLRLSFMHQYHFANKHFVLQTSTSYMYTNYYNHHSFTLSPELFYFTNSGWRFSINPAYSLYSSKYTFNNVDLPDYLGQAEFNFKRYYHDNFLVSLGVRKEFGIPIPGTFEEYTDMTYKAFYDLNGNKTQDENEPGIENVVIHVGNWDVLTKEDGQAMMKNTDPGTYEYKVLPLTDLKGWFPLISDSLKIFESGDVNIPFVRGVKVYGKVYIDKENALHENDNGFDLSGIKISAVNGYTFHTLTGTDGSFEFYLPFGNYTVTLDENILNGRYYIVKNNYELDLSGEVDNMYITFHIIEKKRKIRMKKFSPKTE
jgi:hypothetical protein